MAEEEAFITEGISKKGIPGWKSGTPATREDCYLGLLHGEVHRVRVVDAAVYVNRHCGGSGDSAGGN